MTSDEPTEEESEAIQSFLDRANKEVPGVGLGRVARLPELGNALLLSLRLPYDLRPTDPKVFLLHELALDSPVELSILTNLAESVSGITLNYNPTVAQWSELFAKGNSAVSKRQIELALSFFGAALVSAKKLFGEKSRNVSECLKAIGRCYAIEKNDQDALKYFESALAIEKETLVGSSPTKADTLHETALICATFDVERAIEHAREELKIRRKLHDRMALFEADKLLGPLLHDRGDAEWREIVDEGLKIKKDELANLLKEVGLQDTFDLATLKVGELKTEHLLAASALKEYASLQRLVSRTDSDKNIRLSNDLWDKFKKQVERSSD